MSYSTSRGFGGIPPVVKNLLIINILMLLATWMLRGTFGVDLTRHLALFYFKSEYFKPYQFITHMFMHGGFAHLFFNMFALWMFGRVLESVWGGKRFLIYYFVTGLGAAALHTLVLHLQMNNMMEAANAFYNTPSPEQFAEFIKDYARQTTRRDYDILTLWSDSSSSRIVDYAVSRVQQIVNMNINIPTVGASGAVFGVLLAFGVLFPNTQLMLLFPPIPIRAKYFVIGYGVLELYLGLTQPGSNVAHFAHLGGMLFGYILIKYWNKTTKSFF